METMAVIELPRDVLHAARMTLEELRRELALVLFNRGSCPFALRSNRVQKQPAADGVND